MNEGISLLALDEIEIEIVNMLVNSISLLVFASNQSLNSKVWHRWLSIGVCPAGQLLSIIILHSFFFFSSSFIHIWHVP
ncbi:hypothetical protein BCR37DRAFT_377611 [Protomyces lactucae-debilis]|uniref:Uncharacterized protein n=1 Tax=Protomyces lactucae-debilis TaxID=2754530 RepID=A0A1Y2FLL4_PROLT|nr:uncharacterized protein BCR37DRAFT_377611 [Protomyces lactucae-debilis]ORY84829.1 hypothetical protein BCR37DRAFT_377611 [Protomyces lactucae-debilis]